MCRSMVDIQSPTTEIRRGKKERKKKPQGKNIMSPSATHGGHKYADDLLPPIFATVTRRRVVELFYLEHPCGNSGYSGLA